MSTTGTLCLYTLLNSLRSTTVFSPPPNPIQSKLVCVVLCTTVPPRHITDELPGLYVVRVVGLQLDHTAVGAGLELGVGVEPRLGLFVEGHEVISVTSVEVLS